MTKPTDIEIEMLNEHPGEFEDPDDGCPECGSTVKSEYSPPDMECDMGGMTTHECTECEWSLII